MVTAIDRYLTEKEYKHSIIRDKEFKSSKQVLEGKARLLRQQGKGKRAEQVTKSDNLQLRKMSCGNKRSWEREVHKSWSKQFGGS